MNQEEIPVDALDQSQDKDRSLANDGTMYRSNVPMVQKDAGDEEHNFGPNDIQQQP
tara:strand:+ start:100 stop:267 length:168 start_codon:yes stop_codon:yes gene_type:complete